MQKPKRHKMKRTHKSGAVPEPLLPASALPPAVGLSEQARFLDGLLTGLGGWVTSTTIQNRFRDRFGHTAYDKAMDELKRSQPVEYAAPIVNGKEQHSYRIGTGCPERITLYGVPWLDEWLTRYRQQGG
jgi:hypothetical protein